MCICTIVMFPSRPNKHCFLYAALPGYHGRTYRRESGIKLVCRQARSMLAGLKLRAHILQRLIHMFEDLVGILAIIAIGRKIRRDELGFGSTTGIDNIRLPMFDRYAVSHSLVSSTVRTHLSGQTHHTLRCTVSEVGCQIKISARRARPVDHLVIDSFDIRPNTIPILPQRVFGHAVLVLGRQLVGHG